MIYRALFFAILCHSGTFFAMQKSAAVIAQDGISETATKLLETYELRRAPESAVPSLSWLAFKVLTKGRSETLAQVPQELKELFLSAQKQQRMVELCAASRYKPSKSKLKLPYSTAWYKSLEGNFLFAISIASRDECMITIFRRGKGLELYDTVEGNLWILPCEPYLALESNRKIFFLHLPTRTRIPCDAAYDVDKDIAELRSDKTCLIHKDAHPCTDFSWVDKQSFMGYLKSLQRWQKAKAACDPDSYIVTREQVTLRDDHVSFDIKSPDFTRMDILVQLESLTKDQHYMHLMKKLLKASYWRQIMINQMIGHVTSILYEVQPTLTHDATEKAISADERTVIFACDGYLLYIDLGKANLAWHLFHCPWCHISSYPDIDKIKQLSVSPDGNLVLVLDQKGNGAETKLPILPGHWSYKHGKVYLFDVKTGKASLVLSNEIVLHMDFNADGSGFYIITEDNNLYHYDIADMAQDMSVKQLFESEH